MENNIIDIDNYKHGYTVGELLDYIEKHKIPREGKVLIQRVHDRYFDGCDVSGMIGELPDGSYGKLPPGSKASGWSRVTRPDYMHYSTQEIVDKMRANPEDYPGDPLKTADELQKSIDEGTYMNVYVVIHSPVGYDEHKHLYLDAHY